ncbi:MAG TPA: alpha/beta hydrolase [Terriglobales bacterium]|nr:alpha/beta hydrolase [Terriglobales bacterium]
MHLLSRGSGYPVLFIHGIPTSGQLWTGVIDRLLGRFTCLAVDLPGLGKTPRTRYGLKQLEALADGIEQIRVEHKIDKWHVVGHDAGSAIAVHYAYQFQERVERLALLSPAVFPELKPFHLFRIIRRPFIGELLAPLVNAIFWNIAMRDAVGQERVELDDAVKDFHAPFSGPWGAWRLMSVLRWGNPAEVLAALPAMLPQLLIPTIIFQGSRDKAVPEQFAQRASALIPECKVVLVDSGHFIPLNNPEAVATELLRFFEGSAAA